MIKGQDYLISGYLCDPCVRQQKTGRRQRKQAAELVRKEVKWDKQEARDKA